VGSSYEDISIENLKWSFPNNSYYANYTSEGLILKLTKDKYYSGVVKQFKKLNPTDILVHRFASSEIEDTGHEINEILQINEN
jgi:hypothetical protein